MYEINDTFTVWEHRLADLQDAINTANNKSAHIGNGGYELQVTNRRLHEYKFVSESGRSEKRHAYVVDVTIVGEYPCFSGWTLVAVNNHFEDSDTNVISLFPWVVDNEDIVIPNRFRTTDSDLCEECGINRYRVSTYILTNEHGEYIQVGSTCLKSYVGNASVARLVSIISSIEYVYAIAKEISDLKCAGRRAPVMFKTKNVLDATAAIINAFGWTSRTRAQENFSTATADYVTDFVSFSPSQRAYKKLATLEVTREDMDTADQVAEWLEELSTRENLNDYHSNLAAVGNRQAVEPKYFGILCSAFAAFKSEQQRMEERASLLNEHFGEIGLRYASTKTAAGSPVNMTIAYSAGPYENQFGVSYMNLMQDSEGHSFVWWTGRSLEYEFGKGEEIEVSFTVKDHSEHNGIKQTVITRAKVS